ncbi:TonB-dependent receptor [Siphonobacter sp. SORGH_AS_1065]|uniref:TonB-dependent receptor n=1 Tax=Siphonobacter sp. SORGH_AS_1065 TaxID=3041795 RepID=UPI00278688D4|nr:TonB-dependent receptor [Siphonobacter sp. SORGH_AS_1065]MDQ1087497.1 iron complex outermembrane receptor protein [Siphonobacter sp. SORGH_AS_1065]
MTKKIFFFLLISMSAFAQRITVTGKVTSSTGEVLAGATVIEKSTHTGTTTDANGQYRLSVSAANAVLVASFVGYDKVELPLNGLTTLDFSLQEGNLLNQVEVVGSRSLNRSPTDTPAPVDIIDFQKVISRTGQLDVNQLLQYAAPSFNSNRQTGSDGADHVDPASLRGLGPDQTLVLINGKRRHQSSLVNLFGTRGRGNTGTDLNAIPASAIERIEILRDGAAAQYGSDAIAGVINIVLKTTTDVLEVNANAGAYQAKYRFDDKKFDGLNYNLNANYGFKIKKDGFVNLTADYNFRDHTNRANTTPGDLVRRQYGDPKAQNSALYLNARLPLSERTQLYAFGGLNYRKGDAYAWTRFADNDRNVPAIYPDGFDPIISSKINDRSITVGVRHLLGKAELDVYNTFGSNRFHYFVNNTLNTSLGASSPRSFDAGGFQLNQNVTGLKFSRFYKEALQGFNFAAGAEYRMENYQIFAGEEASYRSYKTGVAPGAQGFPGFQPGDVINKGRSNLGVYVDMEADITKAFLFGVAARYEHYSDFGGTINGKLSARYKVTDFLTLRATASTGFRAPSLPQIYFNSTITNFVNGIPVQVLIARNNSPVTQTLGIPKLKQETSQNLSAGITLNPTNNLSLTVDGYLVKIKNRIVLTGQFSDDDNVIGKDLKALNVGQAQFFTNAISTTTKGLDVILTHRTGLGNGSLTSSLAANFNQLTINGEPNTTPKLKGKERIYFNLRERYFTIASAPPSKINLSFDYTLRKFNVMLRFVRFGEIKLANWNYAENVPDAEKFDIYKPKVTTDVTLGYRFTPKVGLALGATNIFNVYPTMHVPSLTESGGAWDPVQMGNNGTFWFTRLNLKF